MVDVSIALDRADRAREADNPHSDVVHFGVDRPLRLDAGIELAPFQIAYQTYGTLNAERSNAVLICHALTGDQHVANVHPVTQKSGWWETMVGPGRPIDTGRYFVICPNVLGACMGTTGPASTNPKTGMPWGLDFPVITIRDMVRAQAMLLDHLDISSLFSMAGGSMGGMQVLQWCASYPRRVFSALPIATSTRHSAQNIAFHEVGRQAVMADPEWRHGRYLIEGTRPHRGLAVARMGAHITYLSDAALHRKFGRKFQDRSNPTFSFDADFEVESYRRHQGARARKRSALAMLLRRKRDLTMAEAARGPGGARVDHLLVVEMVKPGARVLDVGCGDGELLRLLSEVREVDGRGIELSRE